MIRECHLDTTRPARLRGVNYQAAEAQFIVSCQSVVSQSTTSGSPWPSLELYSSKAIKEEEEVVSQCTSFTASRMSYGAINPGIRDYAREKNAIIVDLRSDTLTKPTAAMRKAMFEAEVGDDVFEEDPTVKELQKMAATLLGKEDALFVSSGTMGNLIAVMNHCDVRGSEIYCGNESHVFLHEQGGAAQIAGASICTLFNNDDGTFDLKSLESAIRVDRIHEPISKLVMVENTINGKVVPQSWVEELAMVAKKHNLRMHLDGARLWNASAASEISAKDLAAPFDSVTFCLSKGLGAPVGSVLCGSKSFIANARRRRKVLGGAMRQVGVIAAAGLVALEQTVPRLVEDHRKALIIAEAINQLDSKIFSVDLKTTHTNMIFINVNTDSGVSDSFTFMKRLHQVNDFDDDDKIIIRCLALTERLVRMVLYYDIDDSMVAAAIRKLRYVIKELDPPVKIEIL
ncbi:L-allo-threonine aldolase isoform X2 [Temnothorax nylanderi]|uniref:L-allo-threonine aldolase isoform X2 n=1 Tax=Temnothorax nylanderi TaxID=102681 RepID=UPI003A86D80A